MYFILRLFKPLVILFTLSFCFHHFLLARPSAQEISMPEQQKEVVYITKTGAKYHRGSCRHLQYSARPIEKASAQQQGYEPCKICNSGM